jgi:uncharacterized protein YceH (UPF0502 family)
MEDRPTMTAPAAAQANRSATPILSQLETRVLGVLVEKQHTVPDTYPLTLNALVAGCNQKTSRDPILDASDADVQAALDALKTHSLVVESSGSRVMRYAHNVERALAIPSQAVALLATLMLRGPQTAGELRINSERLHRFADISAAEGFLREMASRPAGALAVELPRLPGTRETRWAQLLAGPPVIDMFRTSTQEPQEADGVSAAEVAALRQSVAQLQKDVEALQGTVARLCAERGVPAPGT